MNTAELKKLAAAATPGPWRIGTPPPNGEQTIGTQHGLMVAVATTGYDVQTTANARLIAAANPAAILKLLEINAELVEALKQSVAWIDGDRTPVNAMAHARAALAKAEGGEL